MTLRVAIVVLLTSVYFTGGDVEMNKITVSEYSLKDGSTLAVELAESDDPSYKLVSRGRRGSDEQMSSFSEAVAKLKPATDEIFEATRSLVSEPQEVEVEFGVKLSAKLGAFIASSSGEANFKIKLKWVKQDDQPGAV